MKGMTLRGYAASPALAAQLEPEIAAQMHQAVREEGHKGVILRGNVVVPDVPRASDERVLDWLKSLSRGLGPAEIAASYGVGRSTVHTMCARVLNDDLDASKAFEPPDEIRKAYGSWAL